MGKEVSLIERNEPRQSSKSSFFPCSQPSFLCLFLFLTLDRSVRAR